MENSENTKKDLYIWNESDEFLRLQGLISGVKPSILGIQVFEPVPIKDQKSCARPCECCGY